jgi:hypothetical protein
VERLGDLISRPVVQKMIQAAITKRLPVFAGGDEGAVFCRSLFVSMYRALRSRTPRSCRAALLHRERRVPMRETACLGGRGGAGRGGAGGGERTRPKSGDLVHRGCPVESAKDCRGLSAHDISNPEERRSSKSARGIRGMHEMHRASRGPARVVARRRGPLSWPRGSLIPQLT